MNLLRLSRAAVMAAALSLAVYCKAPVAERPDDVQHKGLAAG